MRSQDGLTLVELVISIVLMGILAVGALVIVTNTVRHSADPMVRQQAVAVAEAYIDEIRRKHFDDPGDGDGEANRSDFDDIDDYNSLPNPHAPQDQTGTAIPGLGDYRVSVTVDKTVNEIGVGSGNEARIDVLVTHVSADQRARISTYRTNRP